MTTRECSFVVDPDMTPSPMNMSKTLDRKKKSYIICLKVYLVYLASRTISCENNNVEMDNK